MKIKAYLKKAIISAFIISIITALFHVYIYYPLKERKRANTRFTIYPNQEYSFASILTKNGKVTDKIEYDGSEIMNFNVYVFYHNGGIVDIKSPKLLLKTGDIIGNKNFKILEYELKMENPTDYLFLDNITISNLPKKWKLEIVKVENQYRSCNDYENFDSILNENQIKNLISENGFVLKKNLPFNSKNIGINFFTSENEKKCEYIGCVIISYKITKI